MSLGQKQIPRNSRSAKLKIRFGPDGVHLFCRETGTNLLIDEIVPPERLWTPAPRHVSIALTNTCDLSCTHCFAPKFPAILEFERIVSWLHELDALGTVGIGFGGGEPTLYPRFAELCTYTYANTDLAVTFTTNGHHLSDQLLDQIKGSVHFVRVSVDGIDETYERIRGRSFAKLKDRLHAIEKAVSFGINYLVNSDTLPELDSAVVFAQNMGAEELLLLPEQPVAERGGISITTARCLRDWVEKYSGEMRLAISELGSDGMPTCNPFPNERNLQAYAHIDAQGILRTNSYQRNGVPIDAQGILAALHVLIKQQNSK